MFDVDPSELENLKREVAELRERLARLEARTDNDKEPTDGR